MIETLRKENAILQNTINQCVNKAMAAVNLETQEKFTDGQSNIIEHNVSTYIDHVKATFSARSEAYQRELSQANTKLKQMESELDTERERYDLLHSKFATLQQLNGNDQLHIRNLEAKVSRLTEIVFITNATTITTTTPQNQSQVKESKLNLLKNNNNNDNKMVKTIITPESRTFQTAETTTIEESIKEFLNTNKDIEKTSTDEFGIENGLNYFLNLAPPTLNSQSEKNDKKEEDKSSKDPKIPNQLDEILNSLP